jgi:copper resistance protein D
VTTISLWDVMVLIAKVAAYAATLGAAGGMFFLASSHALIEASSDRRIRRIIGMLLIASALASGVKILATASSMSGDLAGMFDLGLEKMILQTGEGRATAIRLLGLVLMLPALPRAGRPPLLAIIGSLAAATSFAWVGHVHALAAPQVPIVVIVLHLLGVAFWLGALVPLLIVTRDADVARVAATASRFGIVALYVVGGLVVAGACLLCMLLRSINELWGTGYGRLVLLKIILVAALLALAALNRLRLTPRLLARDARAATTLRGSISLEIAAAAAILIVTAAMTTLTGPSARVPAAQPRASRDEIRTAGVPEYYNQRLDP